MAEEIMVIAIVAIIMGTVIAMTQMIMSHKEKLRGVRGNVDEDSASMTSSELEKMLHRAVQKATNPLVDRMEALEGRLDTPAALPEHTELIDIDEAPSSTREPAMAERRRSR